jgi:hypothetical protein
LIEIVKSLALQIIVEEIIDETVSYAEKLIEALPRGAVIAVGA